LKEGEWINENEFVVLGIFQEESGLSHGLVIDVSQHRIWAIQSVDNRNNLLGKILTLIKRSSKWTSIKMDFEQGDLFF